MNLFKKLFGNQNSKKTIDLNRQALDKFDEKLNEHLKSMIEIAYEYVNWNDKEVKNIFIFGNIEAMLHFDFCYLIDNNIVEKHDVGNYLKNVNTDDSIQINALDIGLKDLQDIEEHFANDKRDIPTRLYIVYSPNNGMDCKISYDEKLKNSELVGDDLFMKWIEELKTQH